MWIDWVHDIDSGGRARSYSANAWPFWAIVWEAAPGRWRWQHLPMPGEPPDSQECEDRAAGWDAAQRWLDGHLARLTGGDGNRADGFPLDRLDEPAAHGEG